MWRLTQNNLYCRFWTNTYTMSFRTLYHSRLVRFIILISISVLVLYRASNHNVSTEKVFHSKPLSSKPPMPIITRSPCSKQNGDMHRCWIGQEMLSRDGDFYQILHSKANKDGVIYIASVDSSFIDMAINMYETSFQRFNITNFLYVCSDGHAVAMLAERGIGCFLYVQDTKNKKATEYGSKDFILEMRVKMKMVTAAVILGFTTVLTDLDVVFTRDPTPHLLTSDADISLMTDVTMDNCGFYVARPTPASVTLHLRTLQSVMTHIIADQDAITAVIKSMTHAKTLKKTNLHKERFACGLIYYEKTKRMFTSDNPCINNEKCITDVIHNNWIVGKPAKIYRFKEMGMWMYDHRGYYSDRTRKFLDFSNDLDFGHRSKIKERWSLMTALTIGRILNRTVIFPKFHCYGCKYAPCHIARDHCTFNTHFHVCKFDEHFEHRYREHVFLNHSLVPNNIKTSISPVIHIRTNTMNDRFNITDKEIHIFNATDYGAGKVSAVDVAKWFGRGSFSEFSVLRFHSLYLDVMYEDKSWWAKLHKALRWSDYRQYKILG